eukprot:1595767-Amphidinium_carterae.1
MPLHATELQNSGPRARSGASGKLNISICQLTPLDDKESHLDIVSSCFVLEYFGSGGDFGVYQFRAFSCCRMTKNV